MNLSKYFILTTSVFCKSTKSLALEGYTIKKVFFEKILMNTFSIQVLLGIIQFRVSQLLNLM